MNRHHGGSKHQPAAASASSPPQPVSMKEWTAGVINSLKSRGGDDKQQQQQQNLDGLICSREYLSCALKIAYSLANQLSTVEEERGYKKKNSSSRPSQQQQQHTNGIINNNNSPLDEKSWSEYISVYCMTKAVEEEKKNDEFIFSKGGDGEGGGAASSAVDAAAFEPLPYATSGGGGGNKSPLGGVGRFQNCLAQHITTLFDNDNNHHHHQSPIDYLNVRGAILNEGAVDGRPLSANGTLEIRSLGIAFYELFSGGRQIAAVEVGGMMMMSSQSTLDDNMSTFGTNDAKRRSQSMEHLSQKTAMGVVRTPSSTSISVESLKLLGLPTAICDLISNMINSVNGDVHNGIIGEAYEFISEVKDDLKLMIGSPNVYLQDVDLTRAANVGLQFGSALYGREAELQTLKECYQRSISSGCEVAMICGTSGIGKSKLSREFARSTNENEDGGRIFLSGRFDKLQSQPLHAISSAFDKYCAWLTMIDHSTAEKVAATLKENLGEEMAILVTAMPNLANILVDDFDPKQSSENDTAVDAQKRLRYLFCQFVEIISRCHEEPLILFLDDCQWIDNASVALLNQILLIKDHRLFFFGSCRDDEMSETHPLNLMLSSVSSFGTKTTKIHLTSMSKGALNEMVSTSLSLLPRITRPFANILHHKTKGSPLFVKQLMMELHKQRLLYPSLSRRRWVWEADKTLDMKIPENVATFITKSFDHLPPEVLSALVVLSCFGACADISMIEVLEREIQQSLIAPLDDAVSVSVLGKRNGEFYFMHDKLQEAAYSMMRPEERCLHHNR